jgi:hypothetical protein
MWLFEEHRHRSRDWRVPPAGMPLMCFRVGSAAQPASPRHDRALDHGRPASNGRGDRRQLTERSLTKLGLWSRGIPQGAVKPAQAEAGASHALVSLGEEDLAIEHSQSGRGRRSASRR